MRRRWSRLAGVAALALGATAAHALECGRATTAIDKAICASPTLSRIDAEVARLYGGLRTTLAAGSRAPLLAQQRGWLAERDARCKGGDAACLGRLYQDRREQLQALSAAAEANDGKLDDLTPVILKGRWKVAAIGDPAGKAKPDARTLATYLGDADLLPVGSVFTAAPGKLCYGADPCEAIGWTVTRLGKVDDGAGIAAMLKRPASARAFVGSSGSPRSYFLLVPQGEKDLLAVFTLCAADHSACRDAYAVWSPASADAGISPRS